MPHDFCDRNLGVVAFDPDADIGERVCLTTRIEKGGEPMRIQRERPVHPLSYPPFDNLERTIQPHRDSVIPQEVLIGRFGECPRHPGLILPAFPARSTQDVGG